VQDDYGRGPTSSPGRVGNGLWCGRHATPSRWHLRVGATLAKVPTSVRQKEEGESPGDRSWHGASRARSGLQGSASKNHHKPEKKGAECETLRAPITPMLRDNRPWQRGRLMGSGTRVLIVGRTVRPSFLMPLPLPWRLAAHWHTKLRHVRWADRCSGPQSSARGPTNMCKMGPH
jgi:hypothetical protein